MRDANRHRTLKATITPSTKHPNELPLTPCNDSRESQPGSSLFAFAFPAHAILRSCSRKSLARSFVSFRVCFVAGWCVLGSSDSLLQRARLCSMSRAASCCSSMNFVRTVAGEFPAAFSTRANNRKKPCAANCAKKSLWKLMTCSFSSRAPWQDHARLRFTSPAPRRAIQLRAVSKSGRPAGSLPMTCRTISREISVE